MDEHEYTLMDMLTTEPLAVRIRRILDGLRAPKDSGEYKYAKYAMLRVFGPSSVSIVGMTLILIGSFLLKPVEAECRRHLSLKER